MIYTYYTVNKISLQGISEIKDLGIYNSTNLCFSHHINLNVGNRTKSSRFHKTQHSVVYHKQLPIQSIFIPSTFSTLNMELSSCHLALLFIEEHGPFQASLN